MKPLLLGVGLQGKAALYDLVQSSDVSRIIAADVNIDDLNVYVDQLKTDKVEAVQLDARRQDEVAALMRSVEAVIVLLPKSLRAALAPLAIDAGIHWIDASYPLPEYQALGKEAALKGLAILPEFGLDPGIDLVLAGQAIKGLDEVHEFYSYGAGVPEASAADNPLKYKIAWTFAGVLSAYQRPGQILSEGRAVDIPANDIFVEENIHTVDVDGLGTMEAYPNGSVAEYLDFAGISDTVRNAGRYALRWPGHSAFWKKLVALGFLNESPLQVGGASISPRQFLHNLLEPQLHYRPDECDLVIVRVDARGLKDGHRKRIIYQVIDWRDLNTGLLAMQRTVGYTASIGAQMILRGDIQKRGLLSPITDIPAEAFFAELRLRGIAVQRQEMSW